MPKPAERGSVVGKFLGAVACILAFTLGVSATIGRTARGTGNASSSKTCTITNVTVGSTGSTLYVMGGSSAAESTATATWGATSMTAIDNAGGSPTGGVGGGNFYLKNATAGTATVTITGGSKGNWACVADEITNANTSSPLDVHTFNNGTATTSPTSNATGTSTKANELAVGVIVLGFSTAGVGGTWQNSFTDGQTNSTNASLDEGFLSVTSTQTFTSSKTGTTSAAYFDTVVAFIDISQPAPSNVDSHILLLGFNWILWPQNWFVHPTWR